MLDSILNLISFSAILWSTSQSLTGALAIYAASLNLLVHAALAAALSEAIVGTYIAVALGGLPLLLPLLQQAGAFALAGSAGRLVGLNYKQLRLQADFRYSC